MQLRWTVEAADDLERIADYLFENTPARAADLVSTRGAYAARRAELAVRKSSAGSNPGPQDLPVWRTECLVLFGQRP